MGYRHIPVIVRPSDLRASEVSHEVIQALRSGRVRLVGFEGQGDPHALLAARARTRAVPVAAIAPGLRAEG